MMDDMRLNAPVADSSAAVTYPPYPEYKESGVEWLRDIPSHWEVKKLKFVSIVQPSNVDKKTIEGEEEILLCNYTDVYKNEYINNRLEFMRATATSSEIKKFAVDTGDVIVTKDSEDPRDIAVPACAAEKVEGLLCGYHLTQIKPLSVYGRYVFRLFQSRGFNAQFVVAANGVTRFGLPQYAISNAFVLLPSTEEQQTIAAFLDYKTTKIDALIAKKKALSDKLAEKRTALISHAVTKGLDPKAPMRDSGIDWLGEIPAHWEVKRLKYLSTYFKGLAFKSEVFGTHGTPLVKASNIKGFRIVDISTYIPIDNQTDLFEKVKLILGDIIISTVGSMPRVTNSAVGQIGSVDELFDGSYLNQNTVCIRANHLIYGDFLKFVFMGNYIRSYLDQMALWIANQAYLEVNNILSACVGIPPLDEQLHIVHYLKQQLESTDRMICKVNEVIKSLAEYRAALITNAVTGKIDVRNFSLPEAEENISHE